MVDTAEHRPNIMRRAQLEYSAPRSSLGWSRSGGIFDVRWIEEQIHPFSRYADGRSTDEACARRRLEDGDAGVRAS